jgi:carbonic anhydrase/acetyltransferase-like protein (isoleucine patch superfamily)
VLDFSGANKRGSCHDAGKKQAGYRMPIYALDGVLPQLDADCWVAPNATLIGKVRLAKGASVWFGAVLRGDNDWISVGENSNIQDNSVVHADPGQPVLIGANVTIGHRVTVHSAHIGDGTLIGMGTTVLNGAQVGRDCLVGAGALITEGKQFENGSMILGAPAAVRRALTQGELAGLKLSAAVYTANAARFRAGLKIQS